MYQRIIVFILFLLATVRGSPFVLAGWSKQTTDDPISIISTNDLSTISLPYLTDGLFLPINFPLQASYYTLFNKFGVSDVSEDLNTSEISEISETLYPVGTILAEFVDPRSEDYSGFEAGSCTVYIAKQAPDLFVNPDGTRRLTGNAEDWLRNAQKLGLPTGQEAKVGAIAVFREGRGGRKYGHVALIHDIQQDGTLIVSEMNFQDKYVVSYRVISGDLAQGYIYR